MPVISRWYATRADKTTEGPFETESEAYTTITLTEDEQYAQNRVHEKHAHVWQETVMVAEGAADYVMRAPPPPERIYVARVPAPFKMPDFQGSGNTREAAIRLLKKIATDDGSRPFPDEMIEVHLYTWRRSAMTVHDPTEKRTRRSKRAQNDRK